ncbi:hypothetical protein [Sphingomonas flavescens]|uniref:hypothetical protein n=1 Tax=Sphingomonas flavescens TaxID=3132797 RepID=UPI0028039CCF|nr:hypothetical protein [Sphingomonas limnosediminicola]
MIYTRRTIQKCLDELDVIPDEGMQKLVERLNDASPARLPTMWEVVILHALSGLGTLEYERAQSTGKQPDISFANSDGVAFVADVTCVSDSGLDDSNPVRELSEALEACKTRLGLPIGGLSLRIESERAVSASGEHTRLLLPDRKDIAAFVRKRVEPIFREQLASGATVLVCDINEPGVCFSAKVEGERFNNISYPSYDQPRSLTRNPLFNALKLKAKKLKGISGLKGVIVCDGDTQTLRPATPQSDRGFTERKIAAEFLRQNSSVHFVLTVSVKESPPTWDARDRERKLAFNLVAQRGLAESSSLEQIFRDMAGRMPEPKEMPVNAALRARERGFGWGKHGGYTMSSRSLTISSRLLMEVLAGKRSHAELNSLQRWRSMSEPPDNDRFPNPFERWLAEGRLPVSLSLEQDPDGRDDMITIKVGEPDAAIAPFRVPERNPSAA